MRSGKTGRSGNQSMLRQGNLSAILRLIHEEGPISRIDLAQRSGLNRATITRLITDLSSRGLVIENNSESSGPGRPAIPLQINPQAGTIASIEIGPDSLTMILCDFSRLILWREMRNFPHKSSPDVVLPALVDLLQSARLQIPDTNHRLFGLSVGVQGLVEPESGRLLFAPNPGWRDVPLRQMLQAALPHVPVAVDNVASLSALGESYDGAAAGHSVVLYISTQFGLGGRLILDQRVMRGSGGFAGELGHMSIDPRGQRCTCGKRGCWETVASQRATLARTHERLAAGEASLLREKWQADPDSLSLVQIIYAADEGDSLAREIFDELGHYLGVGIANLINALNPQRVVLGGVLSLAWAHLQKRMEATVLEQALQWSRAGCEIVVAHHGADATLMGGVALIHQQSLDQPEHWL